MQQQAAILLIRRVIYTTGIRDSNAYVFPSASSMTGFLLSEALGEKGVSRSQTLGFNGSIVG
jgi:hypothetical protein